MTWLIEAIITIAAAAVVLAAVLLYLRGTDEYDRWR
jgi:hypothetical protein